MMSHKVLIYVALVVLIVQVAVSSAGAGIQNKNCKCTKFNSKGDCTETVCPCPPGTKCTPKKGAPAVKAGAASASKTEGAPAAASKTSSTKSSPRAPGQ